MAAFFVILAIVLFIPIAFFNPKKQAPEENVNIRITTSDDEEPESTQSIDSQPIKAANLTEEEVRFILTQASQLKDAMLKKNVRPIEQLKIFGLNFHCFSDHKVFLMDDYLQRQIEEGCMLAGMDPSSFVGAAIQFMLKWQIANKSGNVRQVYKDGVESGLVIYTKPQMQKLAFVEPTKEEKEETEALLKNLGVNHKFYTQ